MKNELPFDSEKEARLPGPDQSNPPEPVIRRVDSLKKRDRQSEFFCDIMFAALPLPGRSARAKRYGFLVAPVSALILVLNYSLNSCLPQFVVDLIKVPLTFTTLLAWIMLFFVVGVCIPMELAVKFGEWRERSKFRQDPGLIDKRIEELQHLMRRAEKSHQEGTTQRMQQAVVRLEKLKSEILSESHPKISPERR